MQTVQEEFDDICNLIREDMDEKKANKEEGNTKKNHAFLN